MRIYIKHFPDNEKGHITKAVEIADDATCDDLMNILLEAELKKELYYLSFDGKTMVPKKKLSDHGVNNNAFITFSLRQQCNGREKSNIYL